MNVSYTGFWQSYSGMGEACRNILLALNEAGVEITTEKVPNYESDKNLGPGFTLAEDKHGNPIDYDIKILHVTPDLITKYLEPTKYHIFHLFWETDKLPDWWVWALNLCDEIWTGCEWNKETFIRSGVKKPIWVCPQPINTNLPSFDAFPLVNNGSTIGSRFTFYSIFQWIERKNYDGLIAAYYSAFEDTDPVALLLKTYIDKFTGEERDTIIEHIQEIKARMGLEKTPPIYLTTELMSRGDVYRLHQTGSCFVLPHRGEGFGIPIAEAMQMGKPVITTQLGGVTEMLPKNVFYPIPHDMKGVFNMDFVPWYGKDQNWAHPSIEVTATHMRYVYENQLKASTVARAGQKLINQKLSYGRIGQLMKQRLKQIEEKRS